MMPFGRGPRMRYSIVTGNPLRGGWCALCGRLITAEPSALERAVALRGPEGQAAIAHKNCLPVGAAVMELTGDVHRPVYFGVVGPWRDRLFFWGVGPTEELAQRNAAAWLATERHVAYPDVLVQSLPCIAIDGDQYERAHDHDRSADDLANHPAVQAYLKAGHEARKQDEAFVTVMGPRRDGAADANPGIRVTDTTSKKDESSRRLAAAE